MNKGNMTKEEAKKLILECTISLESAIHLIKLKRLTAVS